MQNETTTTEAKSKAKFTPKQNTGWVAVMVITDTNQVVEENLQTGERRTVTLSK